MKILDNTIFYERDIYFIFIGVSYFCSMHTLHTSTTSAIYFSDITAAIPDITECTHEKCKFNFKTTVLKQLIEDNFV